MFYAPSGQMVEKNIVIIGAGISGLAAAWFLKKKYPKSKITILEKSSRAGGLIQTRIENGFLFETGPHSLRASDNSQETIHLIRDLGMEKQIIFASPHSRRRYLFIDGKLREVPSSFAGLIKQLWMWPMVLAAIRERFRPPEHHEEETVQSFFTRRFGKTFTETLVDPLCLGIYAGDISRLSLPSCFPLLYEWEHTFGSITKGMFHKRKKSQDPLFSKCQEAGSFSFFQGMEELPKALVTKLQAKIHFAISDLAINFQPRHIQVTYRTSEVCSIVADHLLFAIPAPELLSILGIIPTAHSVCGKMEPITSVNLGFRRPLLNHQGFGYLVPSKEQSPILGMIWDSSVFPQQNQLPQARISHRVSSEDERDVRSDLAQEHCPKDKARAEDGLTDRSNSPRVWEKSGQASRLAVMIKSRQTEDCLKTALRALHAHLGISSDPDAVHITEQAIPQYHLGHRQSIEKLEREVKNLHPHISLIGNHFFGVGVNDCIVHARSVVDSLP